MAEEVDYVVIGAGIAGLVAAHLLPGTVRIVDPNPGSYKVGESVAPELFHHPALRARLADVRALPSYTPKHGVTFISGDQAAHFPISTDEEPGAMHVARHELEQMLMSRWNPALVREAVVRVDIEAGTVETATQRLRARQLVVDASGPAMVVAQQLGEVESLGAISATWRYFDVVARDDDAMLSTLQARGVQVRRYDARRKQLLSPETWAKWRPGHNTILEQLGPGRWCWQIPLHGGTRLSLGIVTRDADPCGDEEFDALVAAHTAPCFRLAVGEQPPPYDVRRGRRAFARRAQRAAGPGFALLGDAFAFADPVYSVGTAIAVNQAVALAEAIRESGWSAATAATFDARGQALLLRCRQAFDFWYSGELLADDTAASEVHDGFLHGRAFQATITHTYGDALESASLRAGAHRDVVQVPGSRALDMGDLPRPPGWRSLSGHACTDGVRTSWAHDDGAIVQVYCLQDPDRRIQAYARDADVLWYYEGAADEGVPITSLMDPLCAAPAAWRRLLAAASG